MIEKDKLIDISKRTIEKSVSEILARVKTFTIDDDIRIIILNKINECFKEAMGQDDFDKFCKYLEGRNMSLFIDNKQNILTVCFYNGFMFVKIVEIIEDYFNFIIGELNGRI